MGGAGGGRDGLLLAGERLLSGPLSCSEGGVGDGEGGEGEEGEEGGVCLEETNLPLLFISEGGKQLEHHRSPTDPNAEPEKLQVSFTVFVFISYKRGRPGSPTYFSERPRGAGQPRPGSGPPGASGR